MVSTRTKYRQKRIELIKECIMILADMLTWEKKKLEKILLPFFKKMKKALEKREVRTILIP
jgi:hypothetical protein